MLTRLPPPSRRPLVIEWKLLANNFPESRQLSTAGAEALLESLVSREIAGGPVYDALVAAAALEHELPLITRDRRALDTYRAIGAEIELLD